MDKQVEFSAVHFVDAKINVGGPVTQFRALDNAGRAVHRITRDETTVYVESLIPADGRIFEIPRSVCVLERRKPEGKGEVKK